jgi:hypothetical protein
MLIYSMSVSVDGFIREGGFGRCAPSEEQFRFHIAQVREFGGYLCGRRLYETMLVWETDPSLRGNELGVMSRTDTAVRVISASPDRVFAALTDSDTLAVWLPPDGMTGRFEHFDARPGGP